MAITGSRIAHLRVFAPLRLSLDAIWRPIALIGVVTLSYAYPLSSLVHALQSDTPLAYLALVPLIGLVMGIWRYHQMHQSSLPRSLRNPRDFAIGSTVILIAVWIGVGMPIVLNVIWFRPPRDLSHMLAFAASTRFDLLSLPVFAAGVLVLLYGVSALRWAWPAIVYCFLIWPYPYEYLLGHILPLLSTLTAAVVAQMASRIPLGATIDATDRTLFTIVTPQGLEQVSIGSACSGFNSVVAWFLIACAIGICICGGGRGARAIYVVPRLVLWFLIGIVATLLSNVVRILLLFACAHMAGVDVAFDWLHLGLGSVFFALIVVAMMRALSPLNLALPASGQPANRPLSSMASSDSIPQAVLFVAPAVALAIGFFLRIGILRLALAFTSVYFVFCLTLLSIVCCFRVRNHVIQLQSNKRRLALAGITGSVIVAGIVALIGTTALALHLKRARAERIPALGWRIDADQRALFSDSVRYGAAFLAAIVLALLTLKFIKAMRHSSGGSVTPTSRVVPWWGWHALIAGSIIVGTLALSVSTTTIASYREAALAASGAVVHDFDAAPPSLSGTTGAFVQSYDWPKQSLGRTATYRRFRYDEAGEQPLWVDVVTSEDADALALHDVQSCYEVHGFLNDGMRIVTINHGTYATIVNFRPNTDEAWSALYWEQRIVRDGKTFFQRIVLLYDLEATDEGTMGTTVEAKNTALQAWATQLLDTLLSDSPT